MVYLYLGAGTKARICRTTWTDRFKMASCPLKGDGFLIPNRTKTHLCGTKNGKVICYRIIDCREMGVWVLKVTIQWTVRAWRPTQTPRIWSQLKLTSNWFKFIPRGCSKEPLISLRSHWSSCQAAVTPTFNVCYMTRWEGTHLDTRKRYLKQAL